ncbi:MAG: hypothetical protein ACRDOK_23155 [Streptosporangiaceae bacterium]
MSEQPSRSEPSGRPPRPGRSGGDRRQQPDRDLDPIGDLQRWLIRSGARNMRRELEGQVRRTLGGQRQDKADVWDVATTEIPPEVGAAPECQWCPICRAARRMRDSGPGVAGPLSGAGEAVATVMQDAIGALDSLLARTGRRGAGRDGASVAGVHADTGSSAEPAAEQRSTAAGPPAEDADVSAARPDSLAEEHGQVGGKPGDRLATAGQAAVDPWATATDQDTAADGTDSGSAADGSGGRGHGPSDRR